MIGIFVLALVVVAISAAVGYSLLTEIKTGETISMAGRNAPRIDAVVSAVAASARPLSGGQPAVPAPAADSTGRAVIPSWVSGDAVTPWGVSYGYCPFAVPDRTDLAAGTVVAVGGQGERRTLSTIALRAEGADRPYVVAGSRVSRQDDDQEAPRVAAFVLSPVPGSTQVPDCGSVAWKDGRFRIVGPVPGIVSVLSTDRLRDAATGLGAVVRWASPSGTGDGRSLGEPAPLSAIMAEWRSARPTRTVVRLMGQGPHILSPDDLLLMGRNGGREGSLEFVSGQQEKTLVAGPQGGARIDLGIDLTLSGVAFSTALGVTVHGGGRLSTANTVLRHLLLDGGDAVLGPGAGIALDPSLDPGAAARIRGGTLVLQEAPGTRKPISAGAGRHAFAIQGGTLVVNGTDVAADPADDWADVENGGRISSIPRYVGAEVVMPTVTLGGGEPQLIRSRTSFGSGGATIDDEGVDAGLVRVTETCAGPTCSAACPTDRRIVSGECEGPGSGWALSSFGSDAERAGWSCSWSQVAPQQGTPSSTARASCARLR